MEVVGGGIFCTCHYQNDFCIKMGGCDSHFNVPLIVKGDSYRGPSSAYQPNTSAYHPRQESQSGFEPRSLFSVLISLTSSAYQPNALPLGQTGSLRRTTAAVVLLNDARMSVDILGTS